MNTSNIIWGITLIFLGLSIIASKSGYLSPGFWLRLLDFWPLIFIIIGLSIISKSAKKKLPFILIIIGLIVVPFIVAIVNPVPYVEQREVREDITVPFDHSIEEVYLSIDGGAGNFKISGGGKDISSGNFSSNYARLIKDTSKVGKRLSINYKTEGILKRDVIVRNVKTEMELLLSDTIPYTVNLKIGASSLDLDFSSVIVKELKVDGGASSINLKLGNKSPLQYVSIKAGASDIDIRIPKDCGVRIKFDGGLSSKKFHNIDFVEEDKIYKTRGYEFSDKKIEIDISAGVSNIDIYEY
ncbi:hypothetical protein H5T89_02910 [bacterium]|nr:hypothetical protein [bacterium]